MPTGWMIQTRSRPKLIECPECGGTEFTKRGSRRVYADLTIDLEIDGWSEANADWIDWDIRETGEEIIYCEGCDSEFSEAELRNA